MQDTKDTFYVTLRDRVMAGNAGRTVVLRGVTRPAVVVVENELPTAWVPADCFLVNWTAVRMVGDGASPLVALTCSIRYGTDGDGSSGGMDRGRLLAGMDAELSVALGAGVSGLGVRSVPKMSYVGAGAGVGAASGTGAAVALGTKVFWGDVTFGPAVVHDERLERTATVEVFGFAEVTG